ncbi:ABC transporter ATP-binding protein [Roseicyclus elongatus]|nr:ATP-binding cassette domain-containing protein [Roseibacterium elongatum]
MTTPLLHIANLHKSYTGSEGTVPVLQGIDLTLTAGETLALTGESGSGKSTLLHLAAALDAPDTGSIRMDGVELAALGDPARAALRRDKVGLVFQQFNLVPSLSVAANISLQARLAGRPDPDLCARLIDRLGLQAVATRYPEQLSGGQQQRVAIARALAARPALILADEPTGNLDETTGDTVLALLLDLVAETDAALLMVTHSTRLANLLSRRVHLSHGQIAPADTSV